MQNLSECQLLDAGKLQEAAKLKDDNEMLLQIGGRDCVALEVRYHKRCYLQYTYPVTHVRSSKSEIYSQTLLTYFAKTYFMRRSTLKNK